MTKKQTEIFSVRISKELKNQVESAFRSSGLNVKSDFLKAMLICYLDNHKSQDPYKNKIKICIDQIMHDVRKSAEGALKKENQDLKQKLKKIESLIK